MSKRIITVSREFGSGGRSIGKLIADKLNYNYYDSELVSRIAKESGMSESFIQDHGEYACSTSSFLFSLAVSTGATNMNRLPISDQIYVMQHNIIKELADSECCVIVGRGADYILRDRADALHTFFYADMPFRIDRIVRLYGERADSPEKRLREKDAKRKTYYRHYTGRQWGVAQNYHISMNSGVVGIERCADIVAQIAKSFD